MPKQVIASHNKINVGAITTPTIHQAHTWDTITKAGMQATIAACRTCHCGRWSPVQTIVPKVKSKLAGTKNAQIAIQLLQEKSIMVLKLNIK
jgi:hypothetical protein